MIPLYDGIPARRFPVVNVTLIVANFAVFLIYELPNQYAAINQASFYPCDVTHACRLGLPWAISWITSMFMHANWHHILGNMVFLAVFGKNVEGAFGRLGYLAFYLGGGVAATVLQTAMTLLLGTSADAREPNLGASGAIAAVLGAYIVLYPKSRVAGLAGWRPFVIPAWGFLGFWFLFQLFEAGLGLRHPDATSGSGIAFFAHVGGFAFGVVVAIALTRTGRITVASTTEPKGDSLEDYPPPTEDSIASALAAPGKSTTAAPPSRASAPRKSTNVRCFLCGHVQAVPLSEATFECTGCGVKLARKTPSATGSL
jgi:membrane associated rhomboid family serine protease